jgi:hypothetical protein
LLYFASGRHDTPRQNPLQTFSAHLYLVQKMWATSHVGTGELVAAAGELP